MTGTIYFSFLPLPTGAKDQDRSARWCDCCRFLASLASKCTSYAMTVSHHSQHLRHRASSKSPPRQNSKPRIRISGTPARRSVASCAKRMEWKQTKTVGTLGSSCKRRPIANIATGKKERGGLESSPSSQHHPAGCEAG